MNLKNSDMYIYIVPLEILSLLGLYLPTLEVGSLPGHGGRNHFEIRRCDTQGAFSSLCLKLGCLKFSNNTCLI
jgi:hypothetical protein